jgi:hypothetical protein
MLRVGDMEIVLAEELSYGIDKEALSGPLLSSEHHSRASYFGRILYSTGKPLDEIVIVVVIAAANHVMDVFQEQPAFSWAGFTSKALPQVVASRNLLPRKEFDGGVLCPHWMLKPPLAQRHVFGVALFVCAHLYSTVAIAIAEVLKALFGDGRPAECMVPFNADYATFSSNGLYDRVLLIQFSQGRIDGLLLGLPNLSKSVGFRP